MKRICMLTFSALVASLLLACSTHSAVSNANATQSAVITLQIADVVRNPQNGRNVVINLGALSFDTTKDRRELVRAVYELCSKPSDKLKEYVSNQKGRPISFWYKNPNKQNQLTAIDQLRCSITPQGKLVGIGEYHIGEYYQFDVYYKLRFWHKDYETFDDLVDLIANEEAHKLNIPIKDSEKFIHHYLQIVDAAKADLATKNQKLSLPSKTITLHFGVQMIDTQTGREGIGILNDFSFDTSKDRRDLIKAVYDGCVKPNDKMKNYIKSELSQGANPSISIYYRDLRDKSGFTEIETLQCKFNKNGLQSVGGVNMSGTETLYKVNVIDNIFGKLTGGTSDKEWVSNPAVDNLVNEIAINDKGELRSSYFSYEFMQLIDSTNTKLAKPKKAERIMIRTETKNIITGEWELSK